MILEGIVTTTDEAGRMHVAAMGPAVDEGEVYAGRITRFLLRPFGTSQTAVHLTARPEGVFHLVDDVLLLARTVVGGHEPPPARPATAVRGWVLEAACLAYEFRVGEFRVGEFRVGEIRGAVVDPAAERLRLDARVVAEHAGRPFIGFNRAAHAVIEGAIFVTRLHLIGADEVARRLDELFVLVEKTGGSREHEAFRLLRERVAATDGSRRL
jgi:hypothetical protein